MHSLTYFFGNDIGISNTENTSGKENRSGSGNVRRMELEVFLAP
jgi:hypothetical protein